MELKLTRERRDVEDSGLFGNLMLELYFVLKLNSMIWNFKECGEKMPLQTQRLRFEELSLL